MTVTGTARLLTITIKGTHRNPLQTRPANLGVRGCPVAPTTTLCIVDDKRGTLDRSLLRYTGRARVLGKRKREALRRVLLRTPSVTVHAPKGTYL